MCGIAGVIGPEADADTIQSMMKSLAHRGPDASSYLERDGLAFGHQRLSIIDISASGTQPMKHATKPIHIIFNGEIYNYLELKQELAAHYPFATQTDTEVILAAYEAYGEACVAHFNGMFAFLILDEERNIVFGARDRVGIKPLFYARHKDTFFFASEIKALLAAGIPARENKAMIFDYLAFGYYDHTPHTFFDGIDAIPAGHTFTLADGRMAVRRYWNLADETKKYPRMSLLDAQDRLRELALDAVRLQLRADVPIGIHFSGGFDSTTLLEMVNRLHPDVRHRAYSFVYNEPESDETEFMRAMIDESHNPWRTVTVTPEDARELARAMVSMQDQPFGGLPTIAYQHMALAERADDVKVILEGQGIDETCAGYPYYLGAYYHEALLGLRLGILKRELFAFTEGANMNVWQALRAMSQTIAAHKETRHHDFSRHIRPELINTSYFPSLELSATFDRPFDSELKNTQYRDFTYTKLPRVLRFNDHATMAASRELRVPFLDHRLVELCFSLPSDYLIRKRQGKYIFRKAMRGIIPRLNQVAAKRSITTPQTKWFQNELKDMILETLSSEAFLSRTWVHADAARKLVEQELNTNLKNSFFIWQLVNLEWWMRDYIDNA